VVPGAAVDPGAGAVVVVSSVGAGAEVELPATGAEVVVVSSEPPLQAATAKAITITRARGLILDLL
jgi:hypothetical protein